MPFIVDPLWGFKARFYELMNEDQKIGPRPYNITIRLCRGDQIDEKLPGPRPWWV